ncbi:MAG: helix-turn-helix domain-containing protein [Clostridia bacterium]|nr:helix-turn-helix domain-containing protein [Clostridia bacterium]
MFGDNLKKYRTEKGFSQSELAEKLYVSRQCVSKWEKGTTQPDLETLIQISELLGVSTDTLIKENCAGRAILKKDYLNKYLFIANILVALFCILSFITLWGFLPDTIPAHWSHGKIDRYGSNAEIFLHIISAATFLIVDIFIFIVLKNNSNKKITGVLHGLIVLFQVAYLIFVIVLYAKYITEIWVFSCFSASFVLCISIAIHPKISKQNSWLGVRIHETLSNETVWNKTNELACYLFTLCSLIIFTFSLIVKSYYSLISFLAYIIPTIISIVYAKYIYSKIN